MFTMTTYLTIVTFFIIGFIGTELREGSQFCDYFNGTFSGEEDCFPEEPDKRAQCWALWHYDQVAQKPVPVWKSCTDADPDVYGKEYCFMRNYLTGQFWCFCEGTMCNKKLYTIPWEAGGVPAFLLPEEWDKGFIDGITLISCAVSSLLIVRLIVWYTKWQQLRHGVDEPEPTEDPLPMAESVVNLGLRPILKLEEKGGGRFGALWKCRFRKDIVAVKVFPAEHKQSWQTEQEVFKLPHMKHEEVLNFIGAEKRHRREDDLSEFWLITAYHEKGSLYEYLNANVVSWPEMCKIAASMARGLSYLHEEMRPTEVTGFKPAVAHRDFKSKNVLLKADMSACIADFSLALICHPGKPDDDTPVQVGTPRYMAPEVLTDAVNRTRDAFIYIDMYACALVLWELVSRCTVQDGPVGEYKLPFQDEVGLDPTLEKMKESVVTKNERPPILEIWRKDPGLSFVCDMMTKCWDRDVEERLSSSGVMERFASLSDTPAVESDAVEINAADINAVEIDAVDINAVEIDTVETNAAKIDAVENNTVEIRRDVHAVEIHAEESNAGEIHAVEIHAVEIHAEENNAGEIHAVEIHAEKNNAVKTTAVEIHAVEIHAEETNAGEIHAVEIHAEEIIAVETNALETNAAEIYAEENDAVEMHAEENNAVEIHAEESNAGEIPAEDNDAEEINAVEIHGVEIDDEEIHDAEIHAVQIHAVQIHAEENNVIEINPEESHAIEIYAEENNAVGIHPVEIHPVEIHAVEIHADENNAVEMHPVEIHPVEIHPVAIHPVEIHPVEIHPVEIHADENNDVEIHTDENNAVELHSVEIHAVDIDAVESADIEETSV